MGGKKLKLLLENRKLLLRETYLGQSEHKAPRQFTELCKSGKVMEVRKSQRQSRCHTRFAKSAFADNTIRRGTKKSESQRPFCADMNRRGLKMLACSLMCFGRRSFDVNVFCI